MGNARYQNGFSVTLHDDLLDTPLSWKRPRRIFVNSMSDLFHDDVPINFIERVFKTMRDAHWHQFQILTKRADRLSEVSKNLEWPSNVWIGTSVESQHVSWRIDELRHVNARVRFLSLEPLLGPLKIDLSEIHWVIVGGESGSGARPIREEWVRDLQAQCQREGIPFFFKQWGGVQKWRNGRLLDGVEWNEFPQLND